MPDDVRMYPNLVTPNNPMIFNDDVCTGCNTCVNVCVMDILMPNPEKGKSPIVLYPDECWYDGSCVNACPLWQVCRILPHRITNLLQGDGMQEPK